MPRKSASEEKKPVGRPPMYTEPDEMVPLIEAYFKQCEQDGKKPTVPGIAYALGFESRQSFFDYCQKEEFAYTLKRAKLRIEEGRVGNMIDGDGSTAGQIFDLINNFNYKQKIETEHTGQVKIIASELDEEI